MVDIFSQLNSRLLVTDVLHTNIFSLSLAVEDTHRRWAKHLAMLIFYSNIFTTTKPTADSQYSSTYLCFTTILQNSHVARGMLSASRVATLFTSTYAVTVPCKGLVNQPVLLLSILFLSFTHLKSALNNENRYIGKRVICVYLYTCVMNTLYYSWLIYECN